MHTSISVHFSVAFMLCITPNSFKITCLRLLCNCAIILSLMNQASTPSRFLPLVHESWNLKVEIGKSGRDSTVPLHFTEQSFSLNFFFSWQVCGSSPLHSFVCCSIAWYYSRTAGVLFISSWCMVWGRGRFPYVIFLQIIKLRLF